MELVFLPGLRHENAITIEHLAEAWNPTGTEGQICIAEATGGFKISFIGNNGGRYVSYSTPVLDFSLLTDLSQRAELAREMRDFCTQATDAIFGPPPFRGF